MKNKKSLKIAIIIIVALIVLSVAFVGAGIAAVKAWDNFIKDAAYAEFAAPLLECLPDGENFVEFNVSDYDLPVTVTHVYTEDNGGCVVRMLTSGYGDDMVILCGVNANGEITGATCISSNETLGIEKTYGDGIGDKGLTHDTIDQSLDTVSGATMTTSAYKNALIDALEATMIISGVNFEEITTEVAPDDVLDDVQITDVTEYSDDDEALLDDGQFFVYLERNNGERRLKTILNAPGLVPQPNTPIRKGYTFEGWYEDAKLTVPWDFSKSIAEKGTIIYAKWELVEEYRIKVIDSEGGTITVNPTKASEGEIVVINVKPHVGKRLVTGSLTVNGEVCNLLSFVMPGEDAVVRAEFEDIY